MSLHLLPGSIRIRIASVCLFLFPGVIRVDFMHIIVVNPFRLPEVIIKFFRILSAGHHNAVRIQNPVVFFFFAAQLRLHFKLPSALLFLFLLLPAPAEIVFHEPAGGTVCLVPHIHCLHVGAVGPSGILRISVRILRLIIIGIRIILIFILHPAALRRLPRILLFLEAALLLSAALQLFFSAFADFISSFRPLHGQLPRALLSVRQKFPECALREKKDTDQSREEQHKNRAKHLQKGVKHIGQRSGKDAAAVAPLRTVPVYFLYAVPDHLLRIVRDQIKDDTDDQIQYHRTDRAADNIVVIDMNHPVDDQSEHKDREEISHRTEQSELDFAEEGSYRAQNPEIRKKKENHSGDQCNQGQILIQCTGAVLFFR